MTESAPGVALLFDDGELVGQLREALRERGAQIVHEGTLAQWSRSILDDCGAQVLVVNLDGDAEEALERLHDMIDGDHPRVVFNDAQASRGLSGWDRARWARHLAVKALAQGDIDPPRPEDAPTLVPHTPAPVSSVDEPLLTEPVSHDHDHAPEPVSPGLEAVSHPEAVSHEEAVIEPPAITAAGAVSPSSFDDAADPAHPIDSETLAAELEALLAADQQSFEGEDSFGHGLNYQAGADLPPLHDGDFSDVLPRSALTLDIDDTVPVPAMAPPPVEPPAFQLDHLSLLPLDEAFAPPTASHAAASTDAVGAALAASASWSLVEDDEFLFTETATDMPLMEVEKLSAADYFAPHVESDGESPLEPGLSLELVAQEDAIAPQRYQSEHEMQLDELGGALSRVVALGAAVDSEAAVAAFLAALPVTFRLPIVLIQHLNGSSAEQLVERLAGHSTLPIRVAEHGLRTRGGEVLLVPPGPPLRLLRDGQLERLGAADSVAPPSIDAVFTAIAHSFGRDVRAIVFAGRANDAVAGAQAVHDRGGQVWAELSPDEYFTDMVHGVQAERLVSFSGTPQTLAARLMEEFS